MHKIGHLNHSSACLQLHGASGSEAGHARLLPDLDHAPSSCAYNFTVYTHLQAAYTEYLIS